MDPYDSYRQDQTAPANPWALKTMPRRQADTPSLSGWGHARTLAPAFYTAGGLQPGMHAMGGEMTPRGVLRGLGAGFAYSSLGGPAAIALNQARQSFGGLHEIKTGEAFKNLTKLSKWKDFGSLGMSGDRDAKAEAEAARRQAVAKWRKGQMTKGAAVMGQAGMDVQMDQTKGLKKALYAGGSMGDEHKIKREMTKFQKQYQDYMLNRTRAGQARGVEAAMADPARLADQGQRLAAERTQGMEGIAEDYRIGQRNNAFNQARRGMQGSSADVEQQGKLGRGRDTAAQGMQAGLDAKAQQNKLGDEQQKAQLMGLIYADDPSMAAAFSRTMEGVNKQSQLLQEQAAVKQQQIARQGATSAGYSQAIGGAMSAGSKPLEYYLSHRGTGA
jgi:hypothetical protein